MKEDLGMRTKTHQALSQYEAAVRKREDHRNKFDAIFEKDDQLKADIEQIESELKALAQSTDGVPDWMEKTGEKGRGGMVKGARFRVRATYAKGADTYDPKKLPPDVLSAPGVVKTVDAKAVEAYVGKYDPLSRVLVAARVEGKWKKPSVYIEPVNAPVFGEEEQ